MRYHTLILEGPRRRNARYINRINGRSIRRILIRMDTGKPMRNTDEHSDTELHATLRTRAEALIGKGTAPLANGGRLNLDTLELLYRRVSNPESAPDVLKLLHELQTHQVELDMLFQQLQSNEDEITEDLAHYRSLYECAPMAYLAVASDGRVIEGNQAAGVLFRCSAFQLPRHSVAELLTPASSAAVAGAIKALEQPGAGVEFLAELPARADAGRTEPLRVLVRAQRVKAKDCMLMVFSPVPDTLPAAH